MNCRNCNQDIKVSLQEGFVGDAIHESVGHSIPLYGCHFFNDELNTVAEYTDEDFITLRETFATKVLNTRTVTA